MSRFRRHQGFYLVLLVCAALIVAVSVWLARAFRAEIVARQHLQVLRKDARELAGASPSLTVENERAMQNERLALENAWEDARARFQKGTVPTNASKPAVPSDRAEAFFDIAQYVERMRTLMADSGIKTGTDERFGFAEFTHRGPDLEDLKWVYRQRRAAETLLRLLVACRPLELVEMKREPLNRPGEAKAGVDSFAWETTKALRKPGVLESVALRVTFVGQTVSLRALLNELALSENSAVVRSVEVEPARTESDKRSAGEHAVVDETSPLVASQPSRFTVTVEFVELVLNETGDLQG